MTILKRKYFIHHLSILIVACLIAMVLLTGCGSHTGKVQKKNDRSTPVKVSDEKQVYLYDIELTVASKNDKHVYCGMYPYHYYQVNPQLHSCRLLDMQDGLPHVISRDDFNLFYDFIMEQYANEALRKKSDDDVFAFSINLGYYDEEGEKQMLFESWYNEFPEELTPIIDKFNELCREEIIPYPTEPIDSVPDFLYDEFGMDSTEYSRDEVAAMVEYDGTWLHQMIGRNSNLVSNMESYYLSLEAEKIADLRPNSKRSCRQVSEEEKRAFAERFANAMGDDWVLGESDSFQLFTEIKSQTYGNIRVGASCDLDKLSADYLNGIIYLDAGCEGMTYTEDFIYNKSGDFFLIEFEKCDNFVDIAKKFAELE